MLSALLFLPSFTHTFCMYQHIKKRLFLLLLPLFLSLPACKTEVQQSKPPQSTHPSQEQSTLPGYPKESQSSASSPQPAEKTTENAEHKEKPLFWDVTDVDISRVDTKRKLVAFTFDDAPARTLENILAVFAAFNETHHTHPAYATFFCNGNRMDNHSSHTLRTAVAMGMELGNHTFSHPNLNTLTQTEIQAEISRTDELLQPLDGKKYHLFRAPFGNVNEQVKQAVYTPIMDWTIDTLDWTGRPADEIVQTVLSEAYNGAIILMHDGYENTVEALKTLLPALDEAGYQTVSVSQLAKAHHCVLRTGSVYIRARKQGAKA